MKRSLIYIVIIFTSLNCCSNGGDELEAMPPISNIPQDYIARYSLNGDAMDSSEFGNHGRIKGTIIRKPNRNNYKNSAMYFSTHRNFNVKLESNIYVSDPTVLNMTNTISISVWIKLDGNFGSYSYDSNDIRILGRRTIVNKYLFSSGYYLGINPYGHLRWSINDNFIESNTPLPIAEWTHIVVLYDEENLKMYLNGVLANSKPYEGIIKQNSNNFTIGQRSNYSGLDGQFQGLIDEVVIYDRSLNQREIDLLFNDDY